MDTDLHTQSRALPRGLILAVYTAAVFVSALLLFAVQPMFTRMVLPRLGGSPSVWSVAMVFFQTMLLAGYAYAHVLMRVVRPRLAVPIHAALLIVAGLTLPLSIVDGWGDPPGHWTALWLIGLFVVSIGLPFFALAANTPLLQAWFVRTGHPDGKDPYFLYAASNVGSFLALLSYPFLLEPNFSLRQHNLMWSGGYWLLFVLIAACGVLLLRSPRARRCRVERRRRAAPAPSWRTLGRWAFLAAVPSGLLVAVTAYISTDVAAAPLLWVIPLSLYLLTWVLVFQSRPLLPHRLMLALQPFAIAAHRRADRLQRHRHAGAGARRASHRLLHHRHGEPRRIGAAAAAGAVSHDLLSGAVGGRHDRRPVRRPDRAVRVLLGRRVPDPAGARRAVPADWPASRLRTGATRVFWAAAVVARRPRSLIPGLVVRLDAARQRHHQGADRDHGRRGRRRCCSRCCGVPCRPPSRWRSRSP